VVRKELETRLGSLYGWVQSTVEGLRKKITRGGFWKGLLLFLSLFCFPTLLGAF
jgi:hypothetical protein